MVLEIIDTADVVTKNACVILAVPLYRTSPCYREFARVFGVDFFSVLSRGSQFKVEAFMFRIAKPESLVLLSPSKQDVSCCTLLQCFSLTVVYRSASRMRPNASRSSWSRSPPFTTARL